MQTIFDVTERARLLRRLDALRPETPARWGRMTAPAMICHLVDALDSAFAPSPPMGPASPLMWPPLKQLVIYVLPWPRGKLQSPPDLLQTTPTDWLSDTARFRTALERVASRDPRDANWPSSEVFGRLSGRDWGALLRTHIHHHFTQFGV